MPREYSSSNTEGNVAVAGCWYAVISSLRPFTSIDRYKERWGDMNVPKRFWEDWALGIWVADVRAAAARQWLNPTQKRLLGDIHFPIKASGVSEIISLSFSAHVIRKGCSNI